MSDYGDLPAVELTQLEFRALLESRGIHLPPATEYTDKEMHEWLRVAFTEEEPQRLQLVDKDSRVTLYNQPPKILKTINWYG